MALILNNVRIENCGIGISAPRDAHIHATGLEITNTKQAILLRDPPTLFQALGLPSNTPPQYLIEALKILEKNSMHAPAQRIEQLRESRLVKWLGIAADLTGLGTTLISAQTQGLVSSAIEKMFG